MAGFQDPLGKLLQKSDHNIIRDYVTGADHLQVYNNNYYYYVINNYYELSLVLAFT